MKQKLLITIILCANFALQTGAQKVGLVLSGGGAKGMAHIGLIRVLEENHIPIDYIAGTSIGAIVGGLYAAGFTPDEMEELFKSDDFYFWSTGKIQKDYRYYFKIPDENPAWIDLRFQKEQEKVKILPPTNFIPQEQMDFAFMELFAATNAACKYDFDSLMVPYFCVATDVHNNKPVVLRKGDLGAAIRASMTVPLVFKPIEIDGVLLFDGGIVNNFPHDIMTETFQPDIIIGHQVADGQKNANPDDLMAQLSNLLMRPTNFEINEKKGILLRTQFTGVGLMDWNKADQIISEGMRTAYGSIDSVKNMIGRRVNPNVVNAKRKMFKMKKPELFFQHIQVEGVKDPIQRKYIIQAIKGKYDVVTISSFKKEYFKLIADEHIRSIMPVSRYNPETGYYDLHLKVVPQKKLEAKIGGNISTKPINQGFASIDYRTYKTRAYAFNSNIYFGRFYSSFKLGARIDYDINYPFYLAANTSFNRWDYFSSSTELFFVDVRPPFIIQYENNTRLEIGFPLKIHNKIFGSAAYSKSTDLYYQTDVFNKADEPDKTTFTAFNVQAGIENNSLNYRQYASEGANRYVTIKFISGEETNIPGTTSAKTGSEQKQTHKYWQFEAHTNRYFRFGGKFATGVLAEAVFSTKNDFINYRSTKLAAPGFYATPHSKSLFIGNFHSNNYLAGGTDLVYHFLPELGFRVGGYVFVPINETLHSSDGKQKDTEFIKNYYLQGLAALVYQTGVGPVSLSLNYYEKENTQFYFMLNFGYIMFNKRGF